MCFDLDRVKRNCIVLYVCIPEAFENFRLYTVYVERRERKTRIYKQRLFGFLYSCHGKRFRKIRFVLKLMIYNGSHSAMSKMQLKGRLVQPILTMFNHKTHSTAQNILQDKRLV